LISAKIIADSQFRDRTLTTFEIECHRFIWSEFMTHKDFSRNAASSRAIPIQQGIDRVRNEPAMPVYWGKNQPGMQAAEELSTDSVTPDALNVFHDHFNKSCNLSTREIAELMWREAAASAANFAEKMNKLGMHKQLVNRVLEPFTMIRAVVTIDDLGFLAACKLRRHKDAQPEIHALFDEMNDAWECSTPKALNEGDWHIPYGDNFPHLTIEEQIKIGVSCAAQVSYRKNDTSLEKAEKIFDMLLKSEVPHASPFEHVAQATPGKHANFHNFKNYRTQLGW
jgi:hypothetical protein